MRLAGKLSVALLYFAGASLLAPRALGWDALGFLLHARAAEVDYGHALYVPAIRVAGWAAAAIPGELVSLERSARLVSALGASLALLLFWRRLERAGAGALAAGAAALLVATTPLVWHEAGSIEPSAWTLAALLLSADAAEAYARERSAARMALLTLAVALAFSLHVVSICALPWLAFLATRRPADGARGIPPAHLALPALGAALTLLLALLGGRLPQHWSYWSGFLPDYRPGVAPVLARHAGRVAGFLAEGAPVLLVLGALSLVRLAREQRARELLSFAWLALPHALVLLALEKPLTGLSLPLVLALGLLTGACLAVGRATPVASTVLGAGLLAQLALPGIGTLPQASEWMRAVDQDRERAGYLARDLPRPGLLFAGRAANALRYFHPDVPVVALFELVHLARARDPAADPVELVRAEVERSLGNGVPCFLSGDGFAFLQPYDPYRLGLHRGQTWFVPEDPRVCLIPIRLDAGDETREPGALR